MNSSLDSWRMLPLNDVVLLGDDGGVETGGMAVLQWWW